MNSIPHPVDRSVVPRHPASRPATDQERNEDEDDRADHFGFLQVPVDVDHVHLVVDPRGTGGDQGAEEHQNSQ